MVLSCPGSGPLNRLAMMVVIPEPVDRLAVFSTSSIGSTECAAYESIGSVLCTSNSGVCIFKPGEPDMGRYVCGVVSSRTGSNVLFGDIVCASGTGDPVGCVKTGGMECGDYGGTVALTWTGVIGPTGPEGLDDGVAASGTDKSC